MRNITPPEIEVEFHNRDSLRKRYALKAKLFSRTQLRLWMAAAQVKSPPKGGFYTRNDVERLDTVFVALRILKQDISFFTSVISSGKTLDKWIKDEYNVSLLDYLETRCQNEYASTAPVLNIIRSLKAKQVNKPPRTSNVTELFSNG